MRAAPQARPQDDNFRPPLLSLLYSGAWSFATKELYYFGQNGWEWGTLAAFATGGIAISQLSKALNDRYKLQAHRRKVKRFNSEMKPHGQARLANLKDIKNFPLLSNSQGIFIGSFPNNKRKTQDVFFDGEGSVSVIAMPGSQKTMSIVVPTLMGNLGESVIVNDPSAEVFSICGPALRKAVYEVLVLTPFADKVKALLGIDDIQDVGLDVFSSIQPAMSPKTVPGQLQRIMNWVMPGKPDMDDKSEFFYRSGREIGRFFSMKEIVEGRKPTLSALRRHVKQGLVHLHDILEEAQRSTAFGGVYSDMAEAILGIYQAAPQQLAGGIGVAEQCLDAYDHFSELGLHTESSSFDPRILKDSKKKTAVFLISTLEMMETMAPTTAMTLTYLFESIVGDPRKGRVTAIIDECGSLVMPKLAASLLYYRKALRCLMIWQDLGGQAEKSYGKPGMRQIMAASQLKICLGTQEPETLQTLSKLCGTQGIGDMSLNDRAGMASSMPDLSPSLSHRSVPLLRPDDIQRLDSDQLLAICTNGFPMILDKVPYWTRPKWNKIAGPSPYHRG